MNVHVLSNQIDTLGTSESWRSRCEGTKVDECQACLIRGAFSERRATGGGGGDFPPLLAAALLLSFSLYPANLEQHIYFRLAESFR